MYPNFEYEKWALRVESKTSLDGGGQHLAPVFEEIIKQSLLPRMNVSGLDPQYNNILEMGCGPAWIGLWLHNQGLCKKLTLSDINPHAVKCVNTTIKNNKIKNVEVFHSNLFNEIPTELKFDCIVLNPPNYENIQREHILGYFGTDLRAADPEWKFHKNFYQGAAKHLTPNGKIFITEVAPYDKEVIIDEEIYDKRTEKPIVKFTSMIKDSGLFIKNVRPIATNTYLDEIGVGIYMLQVMHIVDVKNHQTRYWEDMKV